MTDRRRPINLLPAVHRTPALEKFFGATVDQMFQTGKTASVSGYIGRKPAHYAIEKDFYKPEDTEAREKYQLEPTMVSSMDGVINGALFYDDLLSSLSAAGALVGDPSRLFESGYYSWAPPVDIDKLNNFQRYYWSGNDVPPVVITMPGMEIPTVVRADGTRTEFSLPKSQARWNILPQDRIEQIQGLDGDFFDGSPVVLINGARAGGFYISDADTITFSFPPSEGDIVEIYRYGNIGDGSRTAFPIPRPFANDVSHDNGDVHVYLSGKEIDTFSIAGDHIVLDTPADADVLVTVTVFPSLKSQIEGRQYLNIEDLTHEPVSELINGLRVRLIDPSTYYYGFGAKPNSTFRWDERVNNDFIVDGVGDYITLTAVTLASLAMDRRYVVIDRTDRTQSHFSRNNRWVDGRAMEWFGGKTFENQAKRPICEYLANTKLFNYGTSRAPDVDIMYGVTKDFDPDTGFDDFGRQPAAGELIFFGNVGHSALDNTIFVWPIVDSFTDPADIALEFVHRATAGDVIRHTENHREFRFTGFEWIECTIATDFAYFDLFDNDGISIGDEATYPNSTFKGSRLFCYKSGEGFMDTDLGFPVEYDSYGALMFQNHQYSDRHSYRDGDFTGFLYSYNHRTDEFSNQWHESADPLPVPEDGVPLNLQANPNFGTPIEISRNNWFNHFSSIVESQDGFEGKSYTENNWLSTSRDLSRGTQIIQAKSPMLKLMLIMAEKTFDLKSAIKFVEGEYSRYKLKVRQKIKEDLNKGLFDAEYLNEDEELNRIFGTASANKTADFPFFLSDIAGGQYFIPLTPALLGITNLHTPSYIVENGVGFILGHDGSKTARTDEITDRLMLRMEELIYESRVADYDPEMPNLIDEFDLFSGKYRTAQYSVEEARAIMQADFEDWVRANNTDYKINNGYDPENPFTWNYSSVMDRDGNNIAGHWRGIYRYYFDTETPNLTPWEMLGFGDKPLWWEDEYGPAPYSRSNVQMWEDLEAGYIRQGPRQGHDSRFVRQSLMEIIPVDFVGNLLDPIECRIIPSAPTQQIASESWRFGDVSPVENLWRRTSSYVFAKAKAMFLMKPAAFVETFWDLDNRKLVHGQWVDALTNNRAPHGSLTVHGEVVDGSVKRSRGVQNWIVEWMVHQGQNPSYLGNMVRGLDVNLAHKMAGFTTPDRLSVNSESTGRVPDENISIQLYTTPSLAADFYSGVVIEHIGPQRWRVIGYNPLDPYFTVEPSDKSGRRISLTGTEDVPTHDWLPNVYYKKDVRVIHAGYLWTCLRNHQSMAVFEESFWNREDQSIYADEQIYHYVDGAGYESRVPYSGVFRSRQEVVEFLYAYERSLIHRGFSFEEGGWNEAVYKFINWSRVDWEGGSFLSVSPAARFIEYRTTNGFILDLDDGAIVNATGHTVDGRNTKVDRFDDLLTVKATGGDDIYGMAVLRAEVEHVLIFDNRTIFDDIIFDPVLNVRQDRLFIDARRTEDWRGRYDARGFIITGGQIVTNFEKSAEDLRYMFDIELADNTVLRDHARHVIGFETRDYLSNLMMNETQQFELYQGMIQYKGATGALNRITRSSIVEGNRDMRFLEEWAFRVAEFGAYNPRGFMELALNQNDMRRQHQIIRLGHDIVPNDPGILAIDTDSDRWVSPPMDFTELETPKQFDGFPNAGYARTNEATYMMPRLDQFAEFAITHLERDNAFSEGESVWLYSDDYGRWQFKYLVGASQMAPEFGGEEEQVLDTEQWSFRNEYAPETPEISQVTGRIDTSTMVDSGSHFIRGDIESSMEVLGGPNSVYVTGNGTVSMAGTYLYGELFPVDPYEEMVALMPASISPNFNGAVALSIRWFDADQRPCSEEPITHLYATDRRGTAGPIAYTRADLLPTTVEAPFDAAYAQLRISVEFSNTTGMHHVRSTGTAVVGLPQVRRQENNIMRADNEVSNGEVVGCRFTTRYPHGLSVGDTVLVNGPIANGFGVSGVLVVTECEEMWFEVDVEEGIEAPTYLFEDIGEVGPQVLRFVDAHFRVRKEALLFPLANTPFYIDDPKSPVWDESADHSGDRWVVADRLNSANMSLHILREQPAMMDSRRIASSLIYDRNTKVSETAISPEPLILERITPIDPIAGLIAGTADKEIDYKVEYDPSNYGEGGQSEWGAEQVGTLWWDLSTAWFINPYTDVIDDSPPQHLDLGDGTEVLTHDGEKPFLIQAYDTARYYAEIKYRTNNWSRLAPNSKVDIYEWTRSLVAPEDTELDIHPDGVTITHTEYVGHLNKEVVVYYFWVRNPTSIPYNRIGRKLDAASCAAIISNPSAAGLPWMAAITQREMVLSGIREHLSDDSTVVQIQLQLTDAEELVPHSQWKLIRPKDERGQPTFQMWKKLRDSLSGVDDNLNLLPHTDAQKGERTGIGEKQSMFDPSKTKGARDSFITMLNYIMARHNFGETRMFDDGALDIETPVSEYLIWSQPTDSRYIEHLPPEAMYGKDEKGNPLRTSDPAEMDAWMARADFGTRVLLDNRHAERPSWSVWEKMPALNSSDNYVVGIAKHYHHAVEDNDAFDELVDSGAVSVGEYVLIRHNEDYDGFWTVVRFTQTDEVLPNPLPIENEEETGSILYINGVPFRL